MSDITSLPLDDETIEEVPTVPAFADEVITQAPSPLSFEEVTDHLLLLIESFITLNPTPSEVQVSSLAHAIDIPEVQLQATIDQFLSEDNADVISVIEEDDTLEEFASLSEDSPEEFFVEEADLEDGIEETIDEGIDGDSNNVNKLLRNDGENPGPDFDDFSEDGNPDTTRNSPSIGETDGEPAR